MLTQNSTQKTFFLQYAEVATKKNVTVRKVTRGSPDSDDSFCDESPDGYLGRRDDQFLVSDRNENKFYGSVHGAPTGNATTFDSFGFGIIGRKLEEYSYLCPGFFPWVNPGPATHESGKFIFPEFPPEFFLFILVLLVY